MSKVFAKTTAGTVKEVEATTVQDAANALGLEGNYTAVVNSNPAEMTDKVNDGDFISLTKAVKGNKPRVIFANSAIVVVREGKEYKINGVSVERKDIKKLFVELADFFGYELK